MFENGKPFGINLRHPTLRKIAVIGDLSAPQTTPGLSYTFVISAAEVALLSSAPRFLNKLCKYYEMSDTQALWFSRVLNTSLIIYMADSYVEKGLSLGAAIGVKTFLHYLGFSAAVTEAAGNTAAIGVSVAKNITSPWGLAKLGASLAGGYIAGRVSFWGTDKIAETIGLPDNSPANTL